MKRDQGPLQVWKAENHAEVVVQGVSVPGGYTTAALGAVMRASLEKLNPGMLGPRNPTFLSAPMTKTTTATLRICLRQEPDALLPLPTLEGKYCGKGISYV